MSDGRVWAFECLETGQTVGHVTRHHAVSCVYRGWSRLLTVRTARGGDEAKVEGLLAGADDYVAKPFNARELIARGMSISRL